jgi:ribosome-binding ATPase
MRCFDSSDVIHVKGRVDPIEDIEIINLELILADLASCENSLGKIEKQLKTKKERPPTMCSKR